MNSTASARMCAFLSGLPSGIRRTRPLFVFQVYIDDSRSAEIPVLVLAGYIATAEAWQVFSDEWQELLPLVSPSKVFKMSELTARWGADDDRILAFLNVARRHVTSLCSFVIPLDAFNAAVPQFADPEDSDARNPYYLAFFGIINCIAGMRRDLKIDGKIEFIFDIQSERKKLRNAWDEVLEGMPRVSRKYLAQEPRFESDTDFLPLQAADMLAWWSRDRWVKQRPMDKTYSWKLEKKNIPWAWIEPTEEQILNVAMKKLNDTHMTFKVS